MISLCQAFVDRAHEVPCIKSFHESETIHGETVSAHHHRTSTTMCAFSIRPLEHCLSMSPTSGLWHIMLMNVLLQIVSQTSATIGVVNEQVIPVPRDHCEMCRIKDERSMPHRMIVGECKKPCNDISQKSSGKSSMSNPCLG